MFKCFGSAKRPKDDKDPKDWDSFLGGNSTEGYLKREDNGQGGSSKQREDTQNPSPSAQAHTNSTAHCSDLKGNQVHLPPTILPNNDKHGSTSSAFGSRPRNSAAESDASATVAPSPHHHRDELQQLKDAAAAAKATVPPPTHNHTTAATFGVLAPSAARQETAKFGVLPSAARQVPATASPSVSTDSGNGASPDKVTGGGGAGSGGFHGFQGSSASYSKPFDGFAASAAKSAPTVPLSAFGTLPAELGGGGRPAKKEAATPPPESSGGGFHGFGAKSAGAVGAARMFQSAMGAARLSTSPPGAPSGAANSAAPAPPPQKTTVAPAAPSTTPSAGGGGAFACFRNGRSAGVPPPTITSQPSGQFDGFGSGRSTANSAFNTNAPSFTPSSAFSAPSSGLNAFGRPMGGGTVSTNTVSFGTVPAKDTVTFGTLRDSAHQQQLEQEQEAKRRVRFEEDEKRAEEQRRKEKEVKKEMQKAAESEDDTENDAQVTREPPRPWGKRPCFRTMLDGGNKKLVLTNPPRGVIDYFLHHVDRSYGCCYDNVSNTFYATSPGDRGMPNGLVVALNGNCSSPAFIVANNLVEPAAIAVYEPGLSVCVVTNKGIFVLTRRDNMQGEMESFLLRQISHRGFHRGICTTANGGIVSCGNGKIRMFDGSVAHGEEKVLVEANYDAVINNTLFAENPNRRNEKSNPCFMDIVENRLVMSDLQKHVISLWEIEESPGLGASIKFVHAIDVATSANPVRGRQGANATQTPLGKCAYAAGIRLDAEGWVLCADAEGRTIQIWDNQLNFVTRLETPGRLPYISGLYIEKGGHLMVCDRKSEMGGLRVYVLEEQEAGGEEKEAKENKKEPKPKPTKPSFGSFAAASRLQGGRF